MAQKLVTAVGNIEPAGVTLEEVHAKIGLEVFQSLGNRGLRYGKRLRGTDNRSTLGNRHKIPQLLECKRHPGPPLFV